MSRRKKSNSSIIPVSYEKKKKPLGLHSLLTIEPLTENQEKLFNSYDDNKNIVAYGVPGSGKTFVVLYKALEEVLDENSPYKNVTIVRSLVQTRDIGFLPGSDSEKSSLFEVPYKNMVKYMFKMPNDDQFEMLYGMLKNQKTINFMSSSFLRGITIDDSIIIVDEMQNLSFHELASIITRVGENCKIMFCGDASQSDLIKENEKNGIFDFLKILQVMPSFNFIEFQVEDIVRSTLVKEFIIAKQSLNL